MVSVWVPLNGVQQKAWTWLCYRCILEKRDFACQGSEQPQLSPASQGTGFGKLREQSPCLFRGQDMGLGDQPGASDLYILALSPEVATI